MNIQGQLADLVEEQRAAVRGLERTRASLDLTREGASLVAEQLVQDHLTPERGAVDNHVRSSSDGRSVVKRPRDELLAHARFAFDQHVDQRSFEPREDGEQAPHDRGDPNKAAVVLFVGLGRSVHSRSCPRASQCVTVVDSAVGPAQCVWCNRLSGA